MTVRKYVSRHGQHSANKAKSPTREWPTDTLSGDAASQT